MKDAKQGGRLMDPTFQYKRSVETNVLETWKRFGFRPTTENERRERQRQLEDRRRA